MELELLSDQEMYNIFEHAICGQVLLVGSYIHCNANNKYFSDCDFIKPKSFITLRILNSFVKISLLEIGLAQLIHEDINNAYGAAMKDPLPYGRFERIDLNISFETLDRHKILNYGFHLEDDLEYLEALHFEHESFPLSPDTTHSGNVSEYQTKIALANDGKLKKLGSNKPMSHFSKWERYVVGYKTLIFCLTQGVSVNER